MKDAMNELIKDRNLAYYGILTNVLHEASGEYRK